MSSSVVLTQIRDLETAQVSSIPSSKLISNSTRKLQQIASFVFDNMRPYFTTVHEQAIRVTSFFKNNTWSTTEISRICLRAFASYTLLGGVLSLGPSTLSFVEGAPFFLLSGGLWYYSHTLIDYENPKELAKVRETALKMPFIETLNTHSWQQIVTHEILSPEEFFTSCKQYMEDLPFMEIISLHQKLKTNYKAYPALPYLDKIPDPILWKEKFRHEVDTKTPLQILDTYSIEQLKSLNLLQTEEIVKFEQIGKVLEKLNKAQEECKTSLITHLNHLQKKLAEALLDQRDEMQRSFEKKSGLIYEWIRSQVLPTLDTIGQTFSAQEIEGLEDSLTKHEAVVKQLREELDILGAHTAKLPKPT